MKLTSKEIKMSSTAKPTVYNRRVEWCLMRDPSLTQDEIKIILNSFSKIDENGDGRISKRELARAYRLAGFNPTNEEIDNLMQEHDTNADGYIDFEEYFDGMKTRLFDLDIEKETMKAAFRVFDTDDDGYITIKELERALCRHGNNLSRAEIKEIMKAADANNDGRIDYDEFVESQLCKRVF